MKLIQKYAPFYLSALPMCIVLYFIYPHYQYYIDPDGTAYLTISQRYANGDYARAINGYWSPWSCWLTAGLIKGGLLAIPASVIINAAGAIGFLFISQSFFLHFGIIRKWQWLMNVTLALFLCYAVFWQSFDDLWECFFLLSALRMMLAVRFVDRPILWICCGVLGSLAYFAKAYSLPFFILNTICCSYFIARENAGKWMKISATAISVLLFCSHFWIVALHHKYGIWTTSTAGTLNMSWYLAGHPQWKEGIDLLIQPVYKDSPYYWEDPWFANGATPHFWDSWHLFGLQILRACYNVYKLLVSMVQLSVFFPLVAVVVSYAMWFGKIRHSITPDTRLLIVSFLLFPSGYLLVNFEARYIWYMLPLGMVLAAMLVQTFGVTCRSILFLIFPLTFLVYPLWCMGKMYDEGMNEFKMAEQLKKLNIHGSFACAAQPGAEVQRIERLAYFSGNQFYSLAKQNAAPQDVLKEMRRYHVNYYFVYGAHLSDEFKDEQGNVFPEITKGSVAEVKIFLVNP